jgi:GT2 family glycosyltransferase
METIDIIVVGLKESQFSERCIKSIEKTCDIPFRIIKSFGGGLAENVNNGFKQVKSSIFGFFQDDWEMLDNKWGSTLYNVLKNNKYASYISAKQLYPNGKIHCAWFDMNFNNNSFFIKLVGNNDEGNTHNSVSPYHGVPVFIKSDKFREIGGQDENFKYSQHEEPDLCLRLGYPLYYGHISYIHHFGLNPDTQNIKKVAIKDNLNLFLKKHVPQI